MSVLDHDWPLLEEGAKTTASRLLSTAEKMLRERTVTHPLADAISLARNLHIENQTVTTLYAAKHIEDALNNLASVGFDVMEGAK